MIQEYALDPSVLVAEFPRHYGFLRDSFGDTGRILSQYPETWIETVRGFQAGMSDGDGKRLEVFLLNWLPSHSMKRSRSEFNGGDWLQEAEGEDARLPFHGILADSNPRGHGRVIPFGQLTTGDHALWGCRRSCRATRTAQDIVASISPILTRSKRVVVIDPYFDVEPRFYNVLLEMISVLNSANCIHRVDEIQICTALKRRRNNDPEATERRNLADAFKIRCERDLPRRVPQGFSLNFTVYFEKKHGVDAHDRHILTDIAGVDLGQGIDQRQDLRDQNHVRINLLDFDEICRLEADFQPHASGMSASYIVESEFSIAGRA